MDSPGQAAPKPKEEVWADTPSEVVHLTDTTFDDFVKVTSQLNPRYRLPRLPTFTFADIYRLSIMFFHTVLAVIVEVLTAGLDGRLCCHCPDAAPCRPSRRTRPFW